MPTTSSDYAARREMFDDIERAVLPILRSTFPLAVVKTRVVNQGENGAPRMGVVVQLDGVPFRKADGFEWRASLMRQDMNRDRDGQPPPIDRPGGNLQ